MIIFSREIENSTEVEPFYRNSPVKRVIQKYFSGGRGFTEKCSRYHPWNYLKPLFKNSQRTSSTTRTSTEVKDEKFACSGLWEGTLFSDTTC